jgi:hypothetical protein
MRRSIKLGRRRRIKKTVTANLKLHCKSATPLYSYAAIYLKNPHGNGCYK